MPQADDGSSLGGRPVVILLGCVFVVMIGYGIALTVLPLYTERVHELSKASKGLVAFHVGLLTSVYALAQLVASPAAGWLGDRVGRRPLLIAGMAGTAVSQGAFAFTTALGWLYGLRVAGGLAASLLTVAATATVADHTSERDRVRGMAFFGAAVSLGIVAGPLLGGVFSSIGAVEVAGVRLDGYRLPFLAAGALAVIALIAAMAFVPESLRRVESRPAGPARRRRVLATSPILGLVAAGQFGLALFEGTFVLYARSRFAFSAAETTVAFLVCGGVMAVLQFALVGPLSRLVRPTTQAAAGFVFMGVGVGGLVVVHSFAAVLVSIGILATGTALVVPSLSALVTRQGEGHFATNLGLKSSAGSLGQFLGPLLGGALLAWREVSPYAVASVMLTMLGLFTASAAASSRSPGTVSARADGLWGDREG